MGAGGAIMVGVAGVATHRACTIIFTIRRGLAAGDPAGNEAPPVTSSTRVLNTVCTASLDCC